MKNIQRLIFRTCLYTLFVFIVISLLLVVPFRWINPPFTMVMMERWWAPHEEGFTLKQTWRSWDDMPKKVALAVVTSEDQRFPLHTGFDLDAIVNAIKSATEGESLRGASTISQQVAKNMYLWTGRSWLRKGLEAWFTVLIELTWTKQRILEVYLNIAEWGRGVFGIEAASRVHFGVSALQLSDMQAALLASTLPSPLRYDPVHPAKHLRDRAYWNLQQQKKLGGVSWLEQME